MIDRIIDFSVRNKFLVLLLVGAAAIAGVHALRPARAGAPAFGLLAPALQRFLPAAMPRIFALRFR